MFQRDLTGVEPMINRSWRVVIFAAAVAVVACSRDPNVLKQRYFDSGNSYVESGKYREAILEYRRAVRADGTFGEARLRLADTYERVGDTQNAFREYVRAADLLPDRVDVQIKAAQFLLVAGRFADAQARAEKVLARDARNVEAQVLVGYSLAGMKNIDGAIAQLERALLDAPNAGVAFSNLGTLQLARGDLEKAEQAFRKAVELDPGAASAWIALANFFWARERFAEAEASLVKARELDPGDLVAARSLAVLYMSINRVAEAEPILRTLAENATMPVARLMLADYYTATNRLDDAMTVLKEFPSPDKVTTVEAKGRIAMIQHAQGSADAAYATVNDLVQQYADSSVAHLVKAQLLLRDRRFDEALGESRRALEIDPRSALGHRLVGEAHAARYEMDAAAEALRESLKIEDRGNDTRLQLARVELARGRTDAALDLAQQVASDAPRRLDARLLVARTLIQRRDVRGASSVLTPLAQAMPKSADVHVALGQLSQLKGDPQGTRAAFSRALALEPGSIDALSGAVRADLAARDLSSARQRVDARLAVAPRDASALMLAAHLNLAANDHAQAERILRQVIEIDAEQLPAYELLGRLYVAHKRLPEAQAEFERLVARRPDSTGARTMVATLLHLQNRVDEARKQYEQIVQGTRGTAVASNNLAWLYSTSGGNLDVALTLAQAAKRALPDRPEVSDTLGWVYYRKGLYQYAQDALEQSVAKEPDNPTYHYHLGLAYAGSGERAKAARALDRALALAPTFEGADEARRLSAKLGMRVASSGVER
jgi:tetratricopeptide (TPR) repeat protein